MHIQGESGVSGGQLVGEAAGELGFHTQLHFYKVRKGGKGIPGEGSSISKGLEAEV